MNERKHKLTDFIYRFAAVLCCALTATFLFLASPMEAKAVVIGSNPNTTAAPAGEEEGGGDAQAGSDAQAGGGEDASLVEGGDAAASAEGGTVTSATITSASVNVRSDASTSASVAGKATNGMEVAVTGEKQDSSGKTWYAVSFESNGSTVTGYIREDLVEAHVSQPEPQPEETTPPEEEGSGETEPVAPAEGYSIVYEDDGSGNGTSDWYLHDNTMGNKYKVSDLLGAQEINQKNQELMDKQTGSLKLIIVVMAVVILILIAVITVFIIKLRNAYDGDEYDDEDEDDDDDDEEDEYDDEDEEDEDEERPKKHRFGRRPSRRAKYEDEDDDEEEDEDEDEEEDYRPRRKAASKKPVKAKPSRRARYEEEEDYRPRRSSKSSRAKSDKNWQSKNFLDDDDLEFEFLDLK